MLVRLLALGFAAITTTSAFPKPVNPLGLKPLREPDREDPRFKQWAPPGPGDVRAPCPALNTLANHGFLPHNGKGMTLPILIEGMAAGLNMGPDFSIAFGAIGLTGAKDPQKLWFDLDELDQHNWPIEHDASLSRQDAYLGNGNDWSFYEPNWREYLSNYGDAEYTSVPTAAKAKFSRLENSIKNNPELVWGEREFLFSYGENALALQGMSDPISGVAKIEYLDYWFSNQRFPIALGWVPSRTPITLQSLTPMTLELYLANPQRLPEGLLIATDTYKEFVELQLKASEILRNLTTPYYEFYGVPTPWKV